MVDMMQQELVALALLAEREREAREVVRLGAVRGRRHVRSGLAAGLARLALALDREAAQVSLFGDSRPRAARRPFC